MEKIRERDTLDRNREKSRQRRIQRRIQRRNKRRNKKILTICSVLGILLIAVMTFFSVFRVTEVKVAGNTRHSDDMVIQYVQKDLLTTNTVLASLFRKSIEVEDIPFVESLDIEALDNHTIRIYVNEKQIVGYVLENNHKMFFDKDGYVLEIMPMTETELQGIQEEKDRFEQLRRQEEGLPPVDENPEGENPDGETNPSEGENPDGEMNPSEGENPDGEFDSTEDDGQQELADGEMGEDSAEEKPVDDTTEPENGNAFDTTAPQVPWILGLDRKNLSLDTQIIVEDFSVFNTIQGIWRISSKYESIPERVLFDEAYNITLVYQNGTILCELGPDTILEEKMTRVAAILPNLTGKTGILHLEDYTIGTEGIIFSQESEYTVMSKINKFLQKNS